MNETESTADRRPGGAWRLFYGLLKTACILGGLPVTVICLMAVVGLLTGNGWIQLIAGTVVAVGLPLFVVDRLLPDDDQQRAKGLTTDVLALIWAGFAVAFVGGGHAVTSGWLAREGDRRAAAGQQTIARLDYWLAAVRPVRRTPAKPLAGGSGRGTARAGAGTARRGGAGSGTGSSAAKPDAGPAFDARADATKARPDARADSRRMVVESSDRQRGAGTQTQPLCPALVYLQDDGARSVQLGELLFAQTKEFKCRLAVAVAAEIP